MKVNYLITLFTICCLCFGGVPTAHAQRTWTEVCDENGRNCHVDNEIMIQFRAQSLNPAVINDPGIINGPLSSFLQPDALDSLTNAAGFNMSSVTVYKVAPQLTTEETTTVDNTGETVQLDDLWSMFLLVLPPGTEEQELCNRLRRLFPLVRFAHLNWTFGQSGPATDPSYAVSQASLHSTAMVPDASINVEGAWDRETGKSTIKVGVADSGIRADHVDLQFNGNTVVVAGYDGISQTSPGNSMIDPALPGSPNGHGTPVAGIIGAVRNNAVGIAGIAGGNGTTQGVSLYSLRCSGIGGGMFSLVNAIVQGITAPGGAGGGGYGVQLMNISLNVLVSPPNRLWLDYTAGMVALRQAHRNKIAIIASAGNDALLASPQFGSDLTFPAHARDAWTLTVGGADENGNYYEEVPGMVGGAVSAAHPFVDVAAPANRAKTSNTAYNTVHSLSSASQTSYSVFSRTSAAAPHATGVAALMMSYYNNPTRPANNLQPEDVENLLKIHAKDIIASPAVAGEDDHTGAGLINATGVIEGLRNNLLYHSAAASADPSAPGIEITAVGGPQDYYMEGQVQAGVYNAQAYRVRIIAPAGYSNNHIVSKRWGLNSSSSFFGPPEPFTGAPFAGAVATPAQMVTMEPSVTVVGPVGKTAVILEGYTYQLNTYRRLDRPGATPGNPSSQPYQISTAAPVPAPTPWAPFDPYSTPVGPAGRSMRYATYSIYIGPVSQRSAAKDPVEELSTEARPAAYPNPATDQATLTFAAPPEGTTTAEVQLMTIAGRVVRSEQQAVARQATGLGAVRVSVAGLPVGTYLYRITTAGAVQQGRLTIAE